MKTPRIFFAALCIFFISTAYADGVKIEGVPIKLGNTVEEVQKALNTTLEPEETGTTTPFAAKKTQLRLKTKGIWVFFEKGKVTTIRLDQPFSGNVGGIKLGDPGAKILKTFGKPIKEDTFGAII